MPTSLTMRLADPSEQRDLELLQLRASLNNPGDREAILANPDAIELSRDQIFNGQVFVAERDDEVVGFAAVLDRPDGDTELDGLFVEPALWRSGIGRAPVDRCATYGRQRKARALHVIGNPHALEFYKAYGFAEIGVHETRFGTGILMKTLL